MNLGLDLSATSVKKILELSPFSVGMIHSFCLADSKRCMETDEVSCEERRENRTFACFWKGLDEPIAIRRKSDVRVHCRANRQPESEMGQWNLYWRGSNE